MTASDWKLFLDRVQSWPETAQDELAAVAREIETGLSGHAYIASDDDLKIIDAAAKSIDDGETASVAEIKAVFAKFRGV